MSIRFASIGTGWIAGEFLKGAREVEGLEYTACYSRSQEKGEEFAKQWGAQKVYTDMEAMAEDKEIDAVYIASPMLCITARASCFCSMESMLSAKSRSLWSRNSSWSSSNWQNKKALSTWRR